MRHFTKQDIDAYLSAIAADYDGAGRIRLIGATSHVWEDFLSYTPEIEMTVDTGGDAAGKSLFEESCLKVAKTLDVAVNLDSPGDYIPLPDGHEERTLDASDPPSVFTGRIKLQHFDPYSVAFRFIARGDEPDYHVALRSMSCGWIEDEAFEDMLASLLPRFTKETIQQDPSEFRRKYKGLQQLRLAARPGVIHRFSPV